MLKSLLRGIWARKRGQTPTSNADELNEAAIKLWRQGELTAAERIFRRIIEQFPRYAPAYGNLGVVLTDRFQFDEGMSVLLEGLNKDPNHAGLHTNIGLLFLRSRQIDDAITHLTRALELEPNLAEASQILAGALLDSCDWTALAPFTERILDRARSRETSSWTNLVTPYTSLLLPLSAKEQQKVAEAYAAKVKRNVKSLHPTQHALSTTHSKTLRIGYYSCDIRDHPICHLASGLFELHDRERFETFVYSYGKDDKSEYRDNVKRGSDFFRDVAGWSTQEIADTIFKDQIDILVDLSGYSSDARPEVLALHPAPIQVNFLGYPGTMGADFMDYIIADEQVLPAGTWINITESVVTLPGCFLPNLRHESRDISRISRADGGLPVDATVFACFAQPSRIEPTVFKAWMEILKGVPHSVLWLREHNKVATLNLLRHAEDFGVSPDRILFAKKAPTKSAHFARLSKADLALDTFLYNGHTTTSDALWAGVPVLTCPGETFASRVASSQLRALGLDELICESHTSYVETAMFYANQPTARRTLRARVSEANTASLPAAAQQYVRFLEYAFVEMWTGYVSGKRAVHIAVPPTFPQKQSRDHPAGSSSK